MATITTRSGKGSPLTNTELDANFTNLNNDKLESSSYTASDVLTKIKTVDGAGSGLDADTLDGNQATAFATAAQGTLADSAVQPSDNISGLTNDSGYITGNQTITLSGDVSGSGTTSITATVANDSHSHTGSTLSGIAVSNLAGSAVQTSAEAFADNDTSLMTSAAIEDRITGKGYLTGNQTITLSGDASGSGTTSINVTVANDSHSHGSSTISGLGVSNLAASAVQTSAEGFSDSDTVLMTAAAVADKIESYGYSTSTGDITGVTAGSGISGGGTSGTVTINHADTSSQASVNNSGATVIQDVTLDTYGHVTGLGSKTMTLADLGYTGETNATADQTASEILTAIKTVDGSGSGLDADTVDGIQASNFVRSDTSDTMNGILTVNTTADAQILLTSTNSYTGIGFNDSGSVNDYIWHNGTYGTFAIGGGGSSVSGKKLHVDGGMSVGSTSDATSTPTNGIYSQGEISVGGSTVWHSGNDGAGSGLDADTLDGQQGSYYYPASNPNGYTTNVGDITGVTAGTNLTGGGTSGTVTLNVSSTPSFTDVYVDDQILSTGDTNTYMQFHAADQWRVVTGGSERFEVNNSACTVSGTLIAADIDTNTINDSTGSTALISYASNAVSGAAVGNRTNHIINGAMQIWQRGSGTFNTNNAFSADRWKIYNASVTRSTDAPAGFTYSIKNTTAGSGWLLQHAVELDLQGNAGCYTGEMCFSFYGKFDSGKSVTVASWFADGAGGGNQSSALWATSVTGTGSWTRYVIPYSGTVTPNASNVCLRCVIYDNVGVSYSTYAITGVQLEVGTQKASPFEHRSKAEELTLCQRYFEKSMPIEVAPNHNVGYYFYRGDAQSLGCGGNSYFGQEYKTTKRTNCTIRMYDPLGTASSSVNRFRTIYQCNGGVQGSTIAIATASDSAFSGYCQYGTAYGIMFHWTAECEL